MNRPSMGIPLPREHGSWVMMGVSFLAGAVTAGRNPVGLVLFLLTVFVFFSIRRPLGLLVRAHGDAERRHLLKWSLIFGAVGTLTGLSLLLVYQLWLLVPLGIVTLVLLGFDVYRTVRTPRPTLASEVAGVTGLALVAPGAYYVATGAMDAVALGLGLGAALHFISSVFFIQMKFLWVKAPPASPTEVWATGPGIVLYQLVLIPIGLVLIQAGLLAPAAWTALIPANARSLVEVIRRKRETDFKRLGWRETGYSLIFLVLLISAYR